MIFFRNRLIFGLIKKIFLLVVKVIYRVLALFCLQLLAIVILLGAVVYFLGGFEGGGATLTAFVVLLFIAIVFAVIGTVKRLLGLNEKKEKNRGAQVVKQPQAQPLEIEERVALPQVDYPITSKPTYYRVKQNPNYVMAEYPDRYELFKIENGKLVQVRTDYKSNDYGEFI